TAVCRPRNNRRGPRAPWRPTSGEIRVAVTSLGSPTSSPAQCTPAGLLRQLPGRVAAQRISTRGDPHPCRVPLAVSSVLISGDAQRRVVALVQLYNSTLVCWVVQ